MVRLAVVRGVGGATGGFWADWDLSEVARGRVVVEDGLGAKAVEGAAEAMIFLEGESSLAGEEIVASAAFRFLVVGEMVTSFGVRREMGGRGEGDGGF
jgi:hypothetical protein